MPNQKKDRIGRRHEEALDKTEEALGKYAEGDKRAGDQLAQEAKKIDPSAPEEVIHDIDENDITKQI